MRDMTDRSGKSIMAFCVQKDCQCTQFFYERCKFFHLFCIYFLCRRYKIIGIFNQTVRAIRKSGFFRTYHRMSTDKTGLHVQFFYFFMNPAFYAAYIGHDASLFQIWLQLL